MSPDRPGSAEEQIRHRVKQELRSQMRAVRGALPSSACEERSDEITKRVVALPELESATMVLAFASIRKEVRTRAIMEAAWSSGKRVALPRMVDDDLRPREVDAETTLVEGAFAVPEPPEEALAVAPEEVDFVLVPALAVDPRGYRIGYGGGYYDRLLPQLVRARSCAIAYDFQLISEVPELPIDVPVDIVVTDRRIIRAG